MELITWDDGTTTRFASSLNPDGRPAILLTLYATRAMGNVGLMPDSFIGTYRSLFGDPGSMSCAGRPADLHLTCPAWTKGETWHYTGGPHAPGKTAALGRPRFCPTAGVRLCSAGVLGCGCCTRLVIYSQDGRC